MSQDYEQGKRKRTEIMRLILDYGMGVVMIVAGSFLFFRDQFDLEINKYYPVNPYNKYFGIAAFIYGVWRIYRGYKKNYF